MSAKPPVFNATSRDDESHHQIERRDRGSHADERGALGSISRRCGSVPPGVSQVVWVPICMRCSARLSRSRQATVTQKEFESHIKFLLIFGPAWSSLRVIGNSRPVQVATIFPVIGYFILLSSSVTQYVDGGIAGSEAHSSLFDKLWTMKLYFLYFGLIALGVGAMIYQMRCPPLVKSFGDASEFVRVQMEATSFSEASSMADQTARGDNVGSLEALRPIAMRNFYALQSARRPFSRMLTTIFFGFGFTLLAIPSMITFLKVGSLLLSKL